MSLYVLSVSCVYELLKNFILGDMILGDKGFLIQDLLRRGVSMNIPPFLTVENFEENEARAAESIARYTYTCSILKLD